MSQRRTTCRKSRTSRWVHLEVELMITVAVMVILAAIASPSMIELVNSRRAAGQTEELVAAATGEGRSDSSQCAGDRLRRCRRHLQRQQLVGQLDIYGRDRTSATPDADENIRENGVAGAVAVTGLPPASSTSHQE